MRLEIPTMKSIGGAEGKKTDKKEESEPAVKIDLSKVKVEGCEDRSFQGES